jgi:hypothetical protein
MTKLKAYAMLSNTSMCYAEITMKTIQTEIPEYLYKQVMTLVKEGWFRDEKDIFSEAIRRFLTLIDLNSWKSLFMKT